MHIKQEKNLNSRFSQQVEYGVINIEYTHKNRSRKEKKENSR
jgi:hypothetical protein